MRRRTTAIELRTPAPAPATGIWSGQAMRTERASPAVAVDARPERTFVWLSLVFGVAFLFATPPLDIPQEARHFARAYMISEGRLLVPSADVRGGATIPRSLVVLHHRVPHSGPGQRPVVHDPREVVKLLQVPLAPQDRVLLKSHSLYSPLAYAPQALGVFVGRQLELPAVALLYLGRLANLLVWIAVVRIAIRIVPVRRWALFMLMLLPMSLYQAASMSADTPTNAVAVLFVAWVQRLACVPGSPPSSAGIAALAGLAALLGLTKPGYWPLALAVLVIPPTRFRGKVRYAVASVLVVAAAVVPSILWLLHVRTAAPPAPGVDFTGQLAFIVNESSTYIDILIATTFKHIGIYFRTFVGILGHVNVLLPGALYVACATALLAVAVTDGGDPAELNVARRAVLLSLFALAVASVMTMAYLGWNPVAAGTVRGVQGRYFLPLALLPLAALPSRHWGSFDLNRYSGWIGGFCSLVLAVALYTLVSSSWTF